MFSSFDSTGYLDSLSVIEFEGDSIKSNITIMSFDYFNLEVTAINEDGKIEVFGYDNDRLDIIFLDSLDFSNVLSVQKFDPYFLFKYSENLVDLDRNGVIDLVYEEDDYVYCIYNIEPGGTNQIPTVIDSYESDSYIDVVFFDFDGDGKTELLVEDGKQFYVYNEIGDSIQKLQIEYSEFLRVSKNLHLETDSISGKQLYLTHDHNHSFITEVTINSDSSVDYEVNTLLCAFSPHEFNEVKMTDVNLDGYDDVLYFSNGAGIEVGVMYGNEDGSFRKREIIVDEVKFPRITKFEDFNNDGAIDIIYTSIRTSDMVLLHNVDGEFKEIYKFDRSGYSYNFSTSDFDNDGFQDIVLLKSTSGKSEFDELKNMSDNGFELVEIEGEKVENFKLVTDLDNDGNKEFIEYLYDEDEIIIYQIEEGSAQKYTQSIVGSWRDMHQFNLDGLGNSEIVFWDYDYDDESYRINIYKYDSEQVKLSFQCKSEDLFGKNPEEFLFFDYNGDGYKDVIAFTADNGLSGRIITLFEYNGSTLVYKR
ncbi:MAG: hypothetical protein ACI86M_003795 [Saprospiraceae bacterium]